MGNDPSSSSPFFSSSSFTLIAHTQEPLYGEVRIMCSNLVPEYYIVYQTLTFTSRTGFDQKLKQLEYYKKNPHPNIVTLLDFRAIETEGICSCGGFLRIQLAYEFFSKTLSEHISSKQESHQIYTETEIYTVIKGVISGLEQIISQQKLLLCTSYVHIDLILIETSDILTNIKLLNPHLNRIGGFYEEIIENTKISLKNEMFNLGVIALKMMLLNSDLEDISCNYRENYAKTAKYTNFSRGIRDVIWQLLEPVDGDHVKTGKFLQFIENSKKYLNNESFMWNGLDVADSNDSMIGGRKDEETLILQPIINLNYNSPEKKDGLKTFLDFQSKNTENNENYDNFAWKL